MAQMTDCTKITNCAHSDSITGVQLGMKGRIRLTRDDGARGGRWMDQSRKQVQAYDYLCHIGEAKE
jgi:hypothetical protein